MMYLLDTDSFGRGDAGQRNIASQIERVGASNVATTVVTLIEIRRGRHQFLLKAAEGAQLIRAQHLLDASEIILIETQFIPIDNAAAAEFDRLRQIKSLKTIGRTDLLIGCIALAKRATLVTRNIRHFRQTPGLASKTGSIKWAKTPPSNGPKRPGTRLPAATRSRPAAPTAMPSACRCASS